MKGIKNVNIITLNGPVKGNIEIKNGKISSINQNKEFDGIEFNEDVYVVPGFIDTHIHGINGSDTMDATDEALKNMSESLAKEGTTAFLATTITQSCENICKALECVKKFMGNKTSYGAELLGVHLEGPFINKAAAGAQPAEYIVNPDVETFKKYQKESGDHIRIVTVAPETEGALNLIKYCRENNIIASIGHTKAKHNEVKNALGAGAKYVTHCFNAMSPLHHRDIGTVGTVLLDDDISAELIADGVHVDKAAIALLYKNKGKDRITLITDSLRAKGLKDGVYDLGGQNVTVSGSRAVLSDGTLAGSVLKMNNAVKNMIEFLNISLTDAVRMASVNPAKKLGVFDRIGSIDINKDADLVVLDRHYQVLMTICKGKVVYKRGE